MSKIDASQINGSLDIPSQDGTSIGELISSFDDVPGTVGGGFVSGAYRELTPAGSVFPTSVVWYENASKTKKLMEKNIIRNSKQMPIYIIYKVYSADGVNVLSSVQDSISYVNNIFEVSRVRTII